jgi:hypothetical protein
MSDSFPIGARVFHLTVHVFGTVVEPDRAMPPDATAVRYDGEDFVWHTPTVQLRPATPEEDEQR